jgi:hypothetical protein
MTEETRLSDREARRAKLREVAALSMAKPMKKPGYVKTVKVIGGKLVVTVAKEE